MDCIAPKEPITTYNSIFEEIAIVDFALMVFAVLSLRSVGYKFKPGIVSSWT